MDPPLQYNFVELKRWEDIKRPGSQAEPGSFFGLEAAFKGTGACARGGWWWWVGWGGWVVVVVCSGCLGHAPPPPASAKLA